MKVIVFGATGTIGRLTVERMLADGHDVTAFARQPQKLDITSRNLSLFAGDATDPAQVAEAVKGHEAVVIAIGAGMSRSSLIRSQGTMNVIQAMQEHGVKRLIVQSTLGAHDSWGNLNFFWKRIMFGALLRPVFKDHELQEQLVRASGLDWTIVRPSAFTDDPARGTFQVGFDGKERNLSLKIPRGDVAAFLTKQLADRTFRRQAVAIST